MTSAVIGSSTYDGLYLLWPLEADSALRRTLPAFRETRERNRLQASRLVFGSVLVALESQAARPGVSAVILLLVIPLGAVERWPTAAAYGQPPHPGLGVRVCS